MVHDAEFLNPPWEPMILSSKQAHALEQPTQEARPQPLQQHAPTSALDLVTHTFPPFRPFHLQQECDAKSVPPGNHMGHPSCVSLPPAPSSQFPELESLPVFHQKSSPLPHEPSVSPQVSGD